MKKTTLITTAVTLGMAAFAVHAAPPGKSPPTNQFKDMLAPVCTCDWNAGECTASWTDVNSLGVTGVPVSYGADIEFEAQWIESSTLADGTTTEVKREASAEVDLDAYSCDGLTCSATVPFALPEYPVDATTSFMAKVKAFETGSDGVTPRNFLKDVADCNLPQ